MYVYTRFCINISLLGVPKCFLLPRWLKQHRLAHQMKATWVAPLLVIPPLMPRIFFKGVALGLVVLPSIRSTPQVELECVENNVWIYTWISSTRDDLQGYIF